MKKIISIIISTVMLFAVGFTVYAFLPQRHIVTGAWTEGFFDAETRTLHPEKLQEFEQKTNKKVSIAHYYRGWESLADPAILDEFETLRKNNWQPMLNVNPYYFENGCPASGKPLYQAIADGNCNEFLHKAGQNLSNVHRPFFLLFAWEMNNDSVEWSIPRTGSTPQQYIAAWQHVHNIFDEEGATNILWVFCPNVYNDKSIAYIDMYPGDDYVDWTGIDGYNFPQIKAVVIYNEDRTEQEHVNWKVDVSKESLDAFSQAMQSKFYR